MRIGLLCLFSWGLVCFASQDNCTGSCTCDFNIFVSRSAQESMNLDGILATTHKECTMLAFLYEKNVVHVPAGSTKNEYRKRWYSAILHPKTSCNVTFFEKAHKKLRRITAITDGYVSTRVPADVLSWDDAMRMMPQWVDPSSSYVFHRDDPDILPENRGQVLIQRVSETEPSYMHAPVVLQYYLISKYSKSKIDPVMLDMAKYIRDTFNTEQLRRHFLDDEGIPSCVLLSKILQKNTVTRIVPVDEIDAAFLEKHGPLLLSEFPLCADFGSDDGRLVHDLSDCNASTAHAPHPNPAPVRCAIREGSRSSDQSCTKYHAMLIIGVRGEGAARRFLVQNWWRRHQFVEISLAYIRSLQPLLHGPSAYAACTPQLGGVPAGFARAAAPYAESGHIDAREPERLDGWGVWN